jgi:hypothetical protein
MTLMKKKFGKYEVCDGLHNSLLIVCNKSFKKFKVHHISKRMFFVESRAPLTWTWKKMSTLTSIQGFCNVVQFFAFKNKLGKFSKWIL